MKKFLLITCLIYCSVISQAQIPIREMPSKKELSETPKYDSTSFMYYPFDRKDIIKQYIGQNIYILPLSKNGSHNYMGFKISIENKKEMADFIAPEDSFFNQSLTILDAYMNDPSDGWSLKLLYKEKDTIFYINRDDNLSINYIPFILQAFYEKSKKTYINEFFVNDDALELKDANTGDIINIKKGEIWECNDIALVDNDFEKYSSSEQVVYHPMLVFKNTKGNEIYVNFVAFYYERDMLSHGYQRVDAIGIKSFSTLKDYKLANKQRLDIEKNRLNKITREKNEIIQKFGTEIGNLINNHKVAIGMTKEMCKLSLGNPFYKRETITENEKFEVWNYDFNTFLYFENNNLKMIDNKILNN
ncbi:MAG: hypothetical protein HXX18_08255 [Bacteroidetes bacterium]|nr:hypothetical protein [Bacteroidota bacterium]